MGRKLPHPYAVRYFNTLDYYYNNCGPAISPSVAKENLSRIAVLFEQMTEQP